MCVDDVDAWQRLNLSEIQAEGFERAFKFLLRAVCDFTPGFGPAHMKIAIVGVLIAPAMDLDLNLLR